MKKLTTQLLLLAVMCLTSSAVFAQYTVSGTVLDDANIPLIGVNILIKGTTTGTVSDLDGNFNLRVPDSATELEFSYTGFRTEMVEVSSTNNVVNITMSDDVNNLDEIVVTGLASSVKRSNLANAVATLDAEQLAGVTSQQTVDGALQGKVPGINITATTGAPGGGFSIRLRGVTSLSGNNQPLIILDGVYISNVEIPSGLRFASGANSSSEEGSTNRLADINPDDIERIEVLKGASAAAIYGTRANGGVLIITTKKGKQGKTRITLDQDFGTNKIINFVGRRQYDAASVAEQFGEDEVAKFNEAVANGTLRDYEKEIYGETGFITNTHLSISGGNDKSNYYLSGSVRDEDGIIKRTGYNRNTFRLNFNHKLSDRIEITSNSYYVNSTANRSFTGNENEGGLSYGYALAFTRDWVDLFPNEDGVYPDNPNYSGNPLFVRDNTKNQDNINRFVQGLGASWRIIQQDNMSLKLKANAGLDFIGNETFVYVPETHQGLRGNLNGFIGQGNNSVFNRNFQTSLVLDNYTSNGLSFSTQAGISWLKFDRDFVFNQTTQLNPQQQNLSQGGSQVITQNITNEEDFGFVAQEAINYRDMIIATVGVRFDKSSLNGDPNKYYAFPKASLALNIANFDFWTNENVDLLKFRVAYGETGNSASFGSLFTPLDGIGIDGAGGLQINGFQGRSDLEPETSKELEFGVDVALMDGRIGFEATYYNRKVENLLYRNSLPPSSGFSTEIRNDLDLENRGIELSLNLIPVSTEKIDWQTSLTFWQNRSEVTRLGVPSFVPPGVAFGLGLGTFFIEEGEPITQLKGNGDNGPETIGDTEPDFQFAWSNYFTFFKNFDANFMFHMKQGGDGLNLTRLLTDIGGTTPAEDQNIEGFIEDVGYIRLREIGLYYNIPGDVIGGNIFEGIRLGVSGRNLLTITDYSSYDPETSTKGGSGLSTNIEVTPFPSSKQMYFHLRFNF